jgi:hypothetical protein
MTNIRHSARRKCEGYSRNLEGRFSEDRWKNRYKLKDAPFQLGSSVERTLVYFPELACDFCLEMSTQLTALKEPGNQTEEDEKLAHRWLRSEQYLAATPTIVLAGMYGAAAFTLLAIGPAWVGFLIVTIPVLGAALWAFSSPA